MGVIIFLLIAGGIVYLIIKRGKPVVTDWHASSSPRTLPANIEKTKTPTLSFPSITVRVERNTERRPPPPKIDLTKLTGLERFSYEVAGVGETSGRKRKIVVEATDEEDAKRLANSAGIRAEVITRLPEPLATDSQKSYAMDLGIQFDDGITKKQMSYLISAAVEEPATPYQLRVAERLGIEFNKYAFNSSDYINNVIPARLGHESNDYFAVIAESYIYSVARYMNRESWDDPLHAAISAEKVQQIVGKVLTDERVLKSVLRQTECCRIGILRFEEGASKETIAFLSVRDMILNS